MLSTSVSPTSRYSSIVQLVVHNTDTWTKSIHILYPFVDLLGDGYSSFTYNKYLLISNGSLAIAGANASGSIVPPAIFQPDLEAYAFAPSSTDEIFLSAYTNLSTTQPAVTTAFKLLKQVGPWPVSL